MANVTGIDLNPILQRLNSTSNYHPFDAETFSDWATEAGDVVTINRNGESYSSPIHTSRMVWKGKAPTMHVSTTGNEKRDAVSRVSRKKYGRGSAGIRSQEGIYQNFVSEDGLLHSSIIMTASILRTEFDAANSTVYSVIEQTTTYIKSEVADLRSDMHSLILQTPEMVRTEVGSAVSSFAHSVIEQTATYIRTEVSNAASAISQSVIEQTTEYVRTEVTAVASGVAWSVITQTMTNIEQQIARKSKIYVQWTDPNDGTNVLYEGDIWIKRQTNRTWNEANAAGEKWNQSGVAWRRKYGDIQYVWKNGAWVMVKDYAVDVENEVRLEQTADGLALIGYARDTDRKEFNSKLEVTARKIRSEVNTANSNLYSVIEQTATNIRSQIENVEEGMQSQIEQTASSITLSVSASKSELYSVIKQTATNVFTGVYDKVGENFSTIEQTASAININVSSAKSSLYSAIAVTSTQISLKVGKGEVISSINQTAESITISASKVNLSGYVKATDLTADYLTTKIANFQSLTSEQGGISVYSVGTTNFSQGGVSCYLPNAIWSLRINRSGNTYTLQRQRYNDDGWTDVGSFSRATQLSGGWSSKKFTVTASPQGNTCYTTLANGSISRSGRTVTIPIKATIDGGATYYDTGHEATGTITVGKSEINAQRGARQTSEPSTDDRVANCSLNGWYVITVSVLGQSKTFKFNVNVG